MFSCASGWKESRKCWSITHDAQRGIEHLVAEGDLPPEFGSIRDRLLSKQSEENLRKPRPLVRQSGASISKIGCDYVFDIPVETARSLTGYRHDQDIPGLTGEAFEVLAGDVLRVPAQQARPSFWKRLFGA